MSGLDVDYVLAFAEYAARIDAINERAHRETCDTWAATLPQRRSSRADLYTEQERGRRLSVVTFVQAQEGAAALREFRAEAGVAGRQGEG